jgi:COP9 signalosome complex subunit 1
MATKNCNFSAKNVSVNEVSFTQLNLNKNESSVFVQPKNDFANMKLTYMDEQKIQKNHDKSVSNGSMRYGAATMSDDVHVSFSEGGKRSLKKGIHSSTVTSSSTLSLHIAAYENAIESSTSSNNHLKGYDEKDLKQKFIKSDKGFTGNASTNFAEIPRQQKDEKESEPEIMQFIASQKLNNSAAAARMDGRYAVDDQMDDDHMDEGEFEQLDLIPSSHAYEPKPTKSFEVTTDYIDYAKLENEYQNPALSYRLLHMFQVCVNRRPEIAKVINRIHTKGGSTDVEFYRRFATDLEKYKNADPNKEWPVVDNEWITSVEEAFQFQLERESAVLKKAQEENVKESIRVSMVKIFDINFRAGKFYEAAKLYSRSLRDYSNSQTVLPMLMNHVKVLMMMQDYLRVETYISQAERSISDIQEREKQHSRDAFPRDEKASKSALQQAVKYLAKINAVLGVTKMCNKNYKLAADRLTSVDHEIFEFSDLLSTTDIAYYGCFCALASYDRNELKEKVINNGNFRKFMEPEGKLVDLIQAFRNNSFINVFQLLEEMRPLLLLNVYIAPHQTELYKLIRRRAFVQYISTFGVISLQTMAKVFRTDTNELIDELVDLIDLGIIDARIDPSEEKLYRMDEDATEKNSQRLLKIQQDLAERTRVLTIRAAIALNGINPSKEMEAEMEAGSMMQGGRGRRRMAPPFDVDDDDEDVVMETQQLSFNGGRNAIGRLFNRFTGGGGGRQNRSQNIVPSIFGIGGGNSSGNAGGGGAADQDLSDTDMNEQF